MCFSYTYQCWVSRDVSRSRDMSRDSVCVSRVSSRSRTLMSRSRSRSRWEMSRSRRPRHRKNSSILTSYFQILAAFRPHETPFVSWFKPGILVRLLKEKRLRVGHLEIQSVDLSLLMNKHTKLNAVNYNTICRFCVTVLTDFRIGRPTGLAVSRYVSRPRHVSRHPTLRFLRKLFTFFSHRSVQTCWFMQMKCVRQ